MRKILILIPVLWWSVLPSGNALSQDISDVKINSTTGAVKISEATGFDKNERWIDLEAQWHVSPVKLKFFNKGELEKEIVISSELYKSGPPKQAKAKSVDATIHPVPIISSDKQFAAVKYVPRSNEIVRRYDIGGENIEEMIPTKIVLYDSNAQKLFERTYITEMIRDPGFPPRDVVVYDSGIVRLETELAHEEGDGIPVLHLYASSGRELLKIPNAEFPYWPDKITASPSGRYFSFEARTKDKSHIVFFDVLNGTFWVSDKRNTVKNIDNDGLVSIGVYFSTATFQLPPLIKTTISGK